LQSRRRFRQPPPTIVAVPLLQLTTRVRTRSFLRLQRELDQAPDGFGAGRFGRGSSFDPTIDNRKLIRRDSNQNRDRINARAPDRFLSDIGND
jgi:hypothetical protein